MRAGLFFSLANSALTKMPRSPRHVRHLSSRLPLPARRLEGKVAIITGGASGIGEATAKLFVSHGAHVVVADVNRQLGSSVASSLSPHAHFFHCNVANEDHVSAVVDFALSQHGHLDVMYNNAGMLGEMQPDPTKLDVKDLQTVMEVNVQGTLLGVKYAARAMMGSGRGSILCTASIVGLLPAIPGAMSYTISKHAVVGLVKSAAADLAPHGIRVNCVSPTAVATPLLLNAIGKMASAVDLKDFPEKCMDLKTAEKGGVTAADVANVALFLSSDEARYISGHNLVVDGAFLASKFPSPLMGSATTVD